MKFTVYSRLAGKGSRTTGTRKNGTHYSREASKYVGPFTQAVAASCLASRSMWEVVEPPYRVTLGFYFAKPKQPSFGWPTRVDSDKIERAVFDGLVAGRVIADDRHVTSCSHEKHWAAAPSGECVQITVEHHDF